MFFASKGLSMKWVGLSGGLASGKSTVANLLRKKRFPVLDADLAAQEVLKKGTPGLNTVIKVFGSDLLGPNGELDRKKMAEIVFSSPTHLLQLESIVHPLVQEKIKSLRAELEQQGKKIAFYDVPLLFEKKLESQFDTIVLVTSHESDQIARMKSRNQWSDEEIRRRLAAQLPLSEKEKGAHHIIRNHGDLADLEWQLDQLLISLSKGS